MWNSLTDCVFSCFCLQVLQYDVEARMWREIGKLQMRRYMHAITEVNLGDVCTGGKLMLRKVLKDVNHINSYLKPALMMSVVLVISI